MAGSVGSLARRAAARGFLAAACAALLTPALPASAGTLDWDVVNWTGTGTTNQAFAVGRGTVTIDFDDINGVINDQGGPLGSPGSVIDSGFLNPTGNNGAENLFVKTLQNTNPEPVIITIDFDWTGDPVTAVSLSIFDIDALAFPGFGFIDEVIIEGFNGAGPAINPIITPVTATPSWTVTNGNTITGNAWIADSGAGSDDATAQIVFDQLITSISITYMNTLTNGQSQWIGLSAISWITTPEPSTGVLLGGGLLALGVWRRRLGR